MVTDPIADLIIRIKNAGKAKKESVILPYSKLKEAIITVLVAEGFLKSVSKKKSSPSLEIVLLYHNGESKIKEVKRISKSSKRVYKGFEEIYPAKANYGMAIYSTPKGILTDRQAIKQKIGGEMLFKIW